MNQLATEASLAMSMENRKRRRRGRLRKNWHLYAFVLPTVLYFLVFHYFPAYGLVIAFKNYKVSEGIWGSAWTGFEHFERFFDSYYFWDLIRNTMGINIYQLALFPIPVIVALAFNELSNGWYKRFLQTVTYAPHFISTVVICGMIISFLNPSSGIVNQIIAGFGGEPISFLTEPGWFKTIFVVSGEWQRFGWGAILYLAALAGVDPQLHEAAKIDGATRLQRIRNVNIPSIMPTIVIMFILNMGDFMTVGFEKIYLLQNELNLKTSDVIQTYVYRSGLLQAQYSFSAAIGLFNSLINLFMLVMANRLAKRFSQTSLW
ncbi:ABC transporter permease [Cohnella fermenti]|uniref:Sugar ABC transporter permease n=1 Tax=Cohnella fermenti TaxID=2565925 RepID=A0A4S4BVD6_9BACL|nr:sugar ABC transporter permease [Cohnella fermenti]